MPLNTRGTPCPCHGMPIRHDVPCGTKAYRAMGLGIGEARHAYGDGRAVRHVMPHTIEYKGARQAPAMAWQQGALSLWRHAIPRAMAGHKGVSCRMPSKTSGTPCPCQGMAIRHNVPFSLAQWPVTSKRSRRRRHDVPCAMKACRARGPGFPVARHAPFHCRLLRRVLPHSFELRICYCFYESIL